MMFLLDANTFITPKNSYYGFDLAPGFWTWLERAHTAGTVASVEAVRQELCRGGDELATWASNHPQLFLPPTPNVPQRIGELAQWTLTRQPAYQQAAQDEFLDDSADLLLVAQAACMDATVVTFEVPAPQTRKRVKIPDACAALGTRCVDLWECMRQTRPRLTLDLMP